MSLRALHGAFSGCREPIKREFCGDRPVVLNEFFEGVGCEGIVSKRFGSLYRSGRSPHWIKVKNPKALAVTREAEEAWAK